MRLQCNDLWPDCKLLFVVLLDDLMTARATGIWARAQSVCCPLGGMEKSEYTWLISCMSAPLFTDVHTHENTHLRDPHGCTQASILCAWMHVCHMGVHKRSFYVHECMYVHTNTRIQKTSCMLKKNMSKHIDLNLWRRIYTWTHTHTYIYAQ